MSNDGKRSRPMKLPKSSRKNRRNSSRLNPSNILSSQLPQRTETSSEQTSVNIDNDLLKKIIDDFTSDIDENRVPGASSILSTTTYDPLLDGHRRRKSVGEQRRDQLTKHMRSVYQGCFEFDQTSNLHDSLNNPDRRKQYSDSLW